MTLSRRRQLGPRLRPTEEGAFFRRRDFIKASAGLLAGSMVPLSGARCASQEPSEAEQEKILRPPLERAEVFPAKGNPAYAAPPEAVERRELTPRLTAATHNNYYEFLPGRGGPVWRYVDAFEVEPWAIEVGGLCEKPGKFDLDDLFGFPHEERVYHFRCVERWAMNVPWSGFPLRKLLEKVEPSSEATHVRFLTANRPEQMPGITDPSGRHFEWPYFEGLRMDEAMHELTMLATGVYGKPLLKQHGAPVRVVTPWKYGYKNPKSIVKIELLDREPGTFWQIYPHEYGFLSNVNPNIPHPRWSQAESYWLDSRERFDTPSFNGYADQVAKLYPDEPTQRQTPLRPGQIAR